MRIGLIGLGAIGSFLVQHLPEHAFVVFDADSKKANETIEQKKITNATLVPRMQDIKNVDMVVEAAEQAVVPHLTAFLHRSDVLVMSVGAFTDDYVLKLLLDAAQKSGKRLWIPSGAIGGLDVLQACNPNEVTLETRKHPKSLGRSDAGETVVFDGPAREACRLFPTTVNVAATLSLAGIGFERTRVKVVSDPAVEKNTHTVFIAAKTGNYRFFFENHPFAENPKTSALAAHSALWAIQRRSARIQVG
ncbi:MAG: aspartate dehydrogenase [Candidatus Micrarchaeota archaeon]|nr:aspartate dehydrogenase [Candidatus Micrarchaeota archaeon]